MALYVRTDKQKFYKDGVIYDPGQPVEFEKPPKSPPWAPFEESKPEPAPAPAPTPAPKPKPGRASDREPI